MPTLSATIDAFVASRECDAATLARLCLLGRRPRSPGISLEITPDEVDAVHCARWPSAGACKPRRGKETLASRLAAGGLYAQPLRQPSSRASTSYARRLRLLPRAHVPPTKGVERASEAQDPNRYLRPEEVERILKVARVLDRDWGKLPGPDYARLPHRTATGQPGMELRWGRRGPGSAHRHCAQDQER